MQKKLPKVFLFIDEFDTDTLSSLNQNIDIIYRDYQRITDKKIIVDLKDFCKKSKRKFYISNNIKLAIQYKTDGIYIPSFNKNINFSNINTYQKFHIIGSAHNKKEIAIKKKQNCSFIFLAPLFSNPKNKKYLDIIKFNLTVLNEGNKFIALGGINQKNINKVYLTKSVGIAGIRWIKKNGPRKILRPF